MLDPYVSVQAPHDMAQLFLQVWKPEAPRRLAENPAAGFGLERQYLSEDAQLFRVGDLRGPQVVWKATGPHTTLGTVRVDDLQSRLVKIFAGKHPPRAGADGWVAGGAGVSRAPLGGA